MRTDELDLENVKWVLVKEKKKIPIPTRPTNTGPLLEDCAIAAIRSLPLFHRMVLEVFLLEKVV